jgi:hypothetical protein
MLKKHIYIFLLFLFYAKHTFSQVNLVPNFSFEQRDSCPTIGDQVELSIGWTKYSNSISTPDYWACNPVGLRSVPISYYHNQIDRRSCDAYMGLLTWETNPNSREHIGIQLNQPLTIGQKYFISFYTVMGGTGDGIDFYETPSNNIGVRLSTVAYSNSNPAPIDNFAHLRSTTIITDTVNWIRISGSIVADSAYNYLMLGNFYDDVNTDTLTQTCSTCMNYYSYYFVDDICLSTDSLLCNGGIDLLPCMTSVKENYINNQFVFYPNPSTDFLTIKNDFNAPFHIAIFNSLGQQLYGQQNITSYNLQLDISSYNTGLLFIKITSQNNQLMYKLLKQ